MIFGYNGRDGVITDANGLLYMRARYYSPELRRFINADIVPGEISNAITLNRYAYANGNPVSNIDPFGLSADRLNFDLNKKNNNNPYSSGPLATRYKDLEELNALINEYAKYPTLRNYPTVRVSKKEPSFLSLFKNADGSYSLYDNLRFNPHSKFHEQIAPLKISGPSLNLADGNVGIGSIEVDAYTGGWETENFDLSLLDFGHAEAGIEFKDGEAKFGAFASIWSPSLSFNIGRFTVNIGAEVGSIGAGAKSTDSSFSFSWGLALGGSIGFSWSN